MNLKPEEIEYLKELLLNDENTNLAIRLSLGERNLEIIGLLDKELESLGKSNVKKP